MGARKWSRSSIDPSSLAARQPSASVRILFHHVRAPFHHFREPLTHINHTLLQAFNTTRLSKQNNDRPYHKGSVKSPSLSTTSPRTGNTTTSSKTMLQNNRAAFKTRLQNSLHPACYNNRKPLSQRALLTCFTSSRDRSKRLSPSS